MIIDISKLTLDNISMFNLIGKTRKGQHLSTKEKDFINSVIFKEIKTERVKRPIIKRKTSEKQRKQHYKEYQHNYYVNVTKLKRKLKMKGR